MLNESSLRNLNAVLEMLSDARDNICDAISELADLKSDIPAEPQGLSLVKLAESILSQPRGGDKQWE